MLGWRGRQGEKLLSGLGLRWQTSKNQEGGVKVGLTPLSFVGGRHGGQGNLPPAACACSKLLH